MKRHFFLLCLAAAVVAAMVFTGCKSSAPPGTGQGSGSAAPVQSQAVQYVRIDYQGAAIGSDIPTWVESAVNSDLEAIKRISRFQGRVPFVDYGSGQNLDLLRSWVNNFNIQAGVSRRITNYVEAQFGGALTGNKDTPENQNYIKEIIASLSSTQFSGLAKEMDYWIKLRIIDNSKKTESEEYRYYVVYSMAETDLQYQIDMAIGKITAETQEKKELKNDVENAMKQVRFNSIQQTSY
jgi:uncharacterized protein (UPF0335 family)